MSAWAKLAVQWRHLERYLLGSCCVSCMGELEEEACPGLCARCYAEISWRPSPVFTILSAGLAWPGAAPTEFEGMARHLILALKYGRRKEAALPLSHLLQDALAAVSQPLDALVPVPAYRWKDWSRGIRHTQVLAESLGRLAALPVLSRQLERVRPTVALGQIRSPGQRRRIVRGAFRAKRLRRFQGARIGLVDDLLTSGSTGAECLRTLAGAGAGPLTLLVVAAPARSIFDCGKPGEEFPLSRNRGGGSPP